MQYIQIVSLSFNCLLHGFKQCASAAVPSSMDWFQTIRSDASLFCFFYYLFRWYQVWPNILVPCWSHRILKLILEWDCRPCCVYLFYFRSNSDASLIWINLISGNVWNLTSRWLCNLEKALGGDVRMYDGTALIVSIFNQKGAKFMKQPYKQVPTRLFQF